jgi:two-component system sensor histidine kinase CpxA
MIRSLFLKIFLWFWLTVVLVGVTLVVMTTHLTVPGNPQWRMEASMYLAEEAKREVESLERDGKPGLERCFEDLQLGGFPPHFLFYENGEEVLGRNPPPEAKDLAEMVNHQVPFRVVVHVFGGDRFAARQVVGSSGRRYTLVVAIAHIPIPSLLTQVSREANFPLAAVFLVGGVLCFWLTRHITSPISQLRESASRIADGRLDTRVEKNLRRRGDEIGGLGLSFDRMAERIESLVNAQQQILGVVSHELRSPLARLCVASGLLRPCVPEEKMEYLDRIELEAENLDGLIGQLLILARIDSGADWSPKEKIDLRNLIQEVAADGNFEAQARCCNVKVTSVDSCATTGIAEHLRRAIENVVRNAIRHTGASTNVEITLRWRKTSLASTAVILVRDHGPGVPAAHLKKIFLPFHRIPGANGTHTNGAGLGLAITERIVRMHGGSVIATNAPDGGLVVELQLPSLDIELKTGTREREAPHRFFV